MSYWKTILINEYALKEKCAFLLKEAVNVAFTGILLWYAVEHRDFIAYGLMAALATYYFTYIVETIRDAAKFVKGK